MKLIGILIAGVVGVAFGKSPISVTLRVKDVSGKPIVGMTLNSNTKSDCASCSQTSAKTGEDGSATFDIDPPPGLKAFEVRPRRPTGKELNCTTLGVPAEWSVPIPEGQTAITAELICPGSAAATLRVLEGDTPVPEYMLDAETYERVVFWNVAKKGERCTFPGLPLGKASEIRLLVVRGQAPVERSQARVVTQVTLIQTPVLTGNVDMGDIQVPPYVADSTLDITLTHVGEGMPITEPTFRRVSPGFTLISVDGNSIYSCGVFTMKGDADSDPPHRVVPFPHGTYFVVPSAVASPNYLKLVERIRAGENLVHSGIPQVTLTAGATSTMTMNRLEVETALYATRQ